MKTDVFTILSSLGYKTSSELQQYYSNINEWQAWWKGYVEDFHRYSISDQNMQHIQLKRKKMGMAKKVCEDWANLLLNDKTFIELEDNDGTAQTFLSGNKEEQNGGVLGASKFWKMGNRLIEREFAMGTACMYLDLVQPQTIDGILHAQSVRVRYINNAKMIVPLSHDNGDITELALFSEHMKDGQEFMYVQIFQELEDGYYQVHNHYFVDSKDGAKKVENLYGEVDSYIMPCKPFVVLMPNIDNNIADVPMGVSIYANAIDQLKGCDLAYDNLYNDILLGKKRIFMNQAMFMVQSAYRKNADGTEERVLQPNIKGTIESTLYVSTGTKLPDEQQIIQEYNPALRVDENKENIQLNLNILASKVGFGQNKYVFGGAGNDMATATEVRASQKDLTESVWKQRIAVQEALTELTRSILIVGKEICGLNIDPTIKITIKFDDTMFSDEEAERMRLLQEISAGVRQRWEYRKKYDGESEEKAREMTGENENVNISNAFFRDDITVA